MTKRIFGILLCFIFLSVPSAFSYSLTFQNWGFNPNSLIGTISPIDEMTMLSLTLNNSTPTSVGIGSFITLGTLQAEHFQNDNIIINNTGINTEYQITGLMRTTGNYSFNPATGLNDLYFKTGSLDLYIDEVFDYGMDTDDYPNPMFGSNDGIKIASFNLINGSGTMDYTIPNPDGRTDIQWAATYLDPGYWFNSNGTDMSTLTDPPLVLAMTDSNNTIIRDPSETAQDEFLEDGTMAYTAAGDQENRQNFLSSNGSFAITSVPIPEPATLFLFGCGLLFIGGITKKYKKS